MVRLSPQALTEFAKTTFGTWDKPVLLVGMFVVITLVAAAGGLASRWRREPGMVVIGAMGVLGAAAVIFGPVFAQADLLAPLAAVVAGVGAFALLHRLGLRASGAGPTASRRTVLLAGGAAVGLGALASAGGGGAAHPQLGGRACRRHRAARPGEVRRAGHARSRGRGVPAAGHADLPHRQQRVLPDRHGAAGADAVGR